MYYEDPCTLTLLIDEKILIEVYKCAYELGHRYLHDD